MQGHGAGGFVTMKSARKILLSLGTSTVFASGTLQSAEPRRPSFPHTVTVKTFAVKSLSLIETVDPIAISLTTRPTDGAGPSDDG